MELGLDDEFRFREEAESCAFNRHKKYDKTPKFRVLFEAKNSLGETLPAQDS